MCSVRPAGDTGVLIQFLRMFASSLAERLCPCTMGKQQRSRVSRAVLEARAVGECRWVRGASLGSSGTFTSFRALTTVLEQPLHVLLHEPENTCENASFWCFL